MDNSFNTQQFNNTQPFNNVPNYTYSYGMAITNITTVNSIEDVISKMQPFGSSYIYVHNTEPIVYIKRVDVNGQMSIQTYDIKLRENKPDFVSREEFDKLVTELNKYKNSKVEVEINEPDAN